MRRFNGRLREVVSYKSQTTGVFFGRGFSDLQISNFSKEFIYIRFLSYDMCSSISSLNLFAYSEWRSGVNTATIEIGHHRSCGRVPEVIVSRGSN